MQRFCYTIIIDDSEDNGGLYEEGSSDGRSNVDEVPSSLSDQTTSCQR